MTIDTDNRILKKLEEQEGKEGSLPKLLEFYRQLVHIQSRVRQLIAIPELSLSSEVISQRTGQGLPLLSFDDLAFDLSLLQDTFIEIIATFAGYSELFGEIPERLKEPDASRLLTRDVVQSWLERGELPPDILAAAKTRESLLQAMFDATLRPLLISYSEALIGLVDQERWRRRYCPVCGGSPDFSFLDKDRGSRWLLCSRCDTEWLFQRLQCPYCGTQDQKALAYFTDDEGLYRLYVCEKCQRYLKAIDLRQAKSEVLLPLERFYSVDLDSQAQQQGYKSHT